jgi:hypothetical protein
MSHKNGNRSRFDRQRKAKMHDRSRIRELRKKLNAQTGQAEAKAAAKP